MNKEKETVTFPELTLRNGSSGLTIYAKFAESFNCVEFATKADKEQPILISPWMQFEPAAMQEARSRLAAEIIRRAMLHDDLMKQMVSWQSIHQSFQLGAERRDQEQSQLMDVARELVDALQAVQKLLVKDMTYVGATAVLPFESHDQAINHILEARHVVAEALTRAGAT